MRAHLFLTFGAILLIQPLLAPPPPEESIQIRTIALLQAEMFAPSVSGARIAAYAKLLNDESAVTMADWLVKTYHSARGVSLPRAEGCLAEYLLARNITFDSRVEGSLKAAVEEAKHEADADACLAQLSLEDDSSDEDEQPHRCRIKLGRDEQLIREHRATTARAKTQASDALLRLKIHLAAIRNPDDREEMPLTTIRAYIILAGQSGGLGAFISDWFRKLAPRPSTSEREQVVRLTIARYAYAWARHSQDHLLKFWNDPEFKDSPLKQGRREFKKENRTFAVNKIVEALEATTLITEEQKRDYYHGFEADEKFDEDRDLYLRLNEENGRRRS